MLLCTVAVVVAGTGVAVVVASKLRERERTDKSHIVLLMISEKAQEKIGYLRRDMDIVENAV